MPARAPHPAAPTPPPPAPHPTADRARSEKRARRRSLSVLLRAAVEHGAWLQRVRSGVEEWLESNPRAYVKHKDFNGHGLGLLGREINLLMSPVVRVCKETREATVVEVPDGASRA